MKGPNLKGPVVPRDETPDPHELVELTIAQAESYLERLNIMPPPPVSPRFEDEVTKMLNNSDSLTLEQIGMLHVRYVRYAEHVSYEHAKAKLGETSAKNALTEVKARLELDARAKNEIPKGEIDQHIRSSKLYLEYEAVWFGEHAKATLIGARLEGIQNMGASISRVITVRTTEVNAGAREHGSQKRGVRGSPPRALRG